VWQIFINVSKSFFLQGFVIHPSYTRKEKLVVFNDMLVSKIIGQIKTWDLWALSLFLLAIIQGLFELN